MFSSMSWTTFVKTFFISINTKKNFTRETKFFILLLNLSVYLRSNQLFDEGTVEENVQNHKISKWGTYLDGIFRSTRHFYQADETKSGHLHMFRPNFKRSRLQNSISHVRRWISKLRPTKWGHSWPRPLWELASYKPLNLMTSKISLHRHFSLQKLWKGIKRMNGFGSSGHELKEMEGWMPLPILNDRSKSLKQVDHFPQVSPPQKLVGHGWCLHKDCRGSPDELFWWSCCMSSAEPVGEKLKNFKFFH